MRCVRFPLLFTVAALVAGLPGAAQDKAEVKLEVVKYDGLKNAVLRSRGTVVLVDFWGWY